MNKKGDLADILYIVLGVIFLAVMAVPVFIVVSALNDATQTLDAPQEFLDESQKLTNNFPAVYQTWFVFFIGGSWIVTMILAFSVDIRPAWFAASFFIMLAIIFVAMLGANAYDDAIRSQLAASANFPIINFIMANMGKIGVTMVFSVGVSLFAKSKL